MTIRPTPLCAEPAPTGVRRTALPHPRRRLNLPSLITPRLTPQTRRRGDRLWAALAALILLGAGGWFIARLTRDSLWLDEAWSLWAVEPASPGGALERVINDVHPPLYFLLLDPWIDLAGDSELAARLPSALAAALCMALLYRLGADCFSPRAGAMAALVLGASSFFAYYAREARMYMLAALLATASMCAYGRWLRRGGARWRWLYIGVTGALLYTHYFGVLIPLAQTAHVLIARQRRGAWLFLMGGVGATLAPWLPFFWWQTLSRPGGLAQALPTDLAALKSLATLLSGGQWLLFGGLAALAILTEARRDLPLVWGRRGVVAARALEAPPARRGTWLAALWAVFPLALTLAVNLVLPLYTPRNILLIAPGVALLVGAGLARLRWPLAAALAALIVLTGPGVRHALLPDKFPWREFVRDLAAHFQPGDPVLIHQGEHLFTLPFRYYFRHRWPGEPEPISVYAMPMPPPGEAFERAVRAATAGRERVWLVMEWPTQISAFTALYLKETRRNREMVSAFEVRGFLFAPPPDPREALRFGPHLTMRYRLDETVYAPGETVGLTLDWAALGESEADYAVAVHLVDRADHVVAANDGPFPVEGPLAAETAFADPRPLTLPPDLPPGVYTIQVFLYTEPDTPAMEVRDEAGMRLGPIPVLRAIQVAPPAGASARPR